MRLSVVAVVVGLLLCSSTAEAQWQSEGERPRSQVYVLESLGSLGGLVGCGSITAVGAGLALAAANWDFWNGYQTRQDRAWGVIATIVGVTGVALMPATAAYGCSRIGDELGEEGSTTWAVIGSYAGVAAGVGLMLLGAKVTDVSRVAGIPLIVAGGLAIPAGPVLGYNLGASSGEEFSRQDRLQLPSLALSSVEGVDGKPRCGVDIRLIGVRF